MSGQDSMRRAFLCESVTACRFHQSSTGILRNQEQVLDKQEGSKLEKPWLFEGIFLKI